MITKSRSCGLLTVCLMVVSVGVQASPFPNSGSLYRDVRDDSLRRVPQRTAPGDAPSAVVESGDVAPVLDVQIAVTHFVVFGNSTLSEEELSALLEPYSHRTLSAAQLEEAMDSLRSAYRGNGLFAAQVYLPPQAIEEGIVTLHVYEGVLEEGGVELLNEGEHVRNSVITSILEENLATGELMRTEEFERTILLVDDLPGVTSHSVVYPGTEPGDARFLLRAQDTPRITGNIDVDNFGSYYTGEERLGATLYVNSPTRHGDQLTFRGVTSGSDSVYGYVEYSIPVTGSGLRLGGSADYLDYELGEELGDLELKGDAYSARLYAAYPIIRARHQNLTSRVD